MNYKPAGWLYKRTRLLNICHYLRLVSPHTQMVEEEMSCLRKHAVGKKVGLEIGTYMGVSASIIASSMTSDAILYCVDPFESRKGRTNPGYRMALRLFKRMGLTRKIKFLLGYSNDKAIIDRIPNNLDFILIDGDHSYEGLKNDWQIVLAKLKPGGIVCLHDTTIPAAEPYRNFGSVAYFKDVIEKDNVFTLLETAYSMNVLTRI